MNESKLASQSPAPFGTQPRRGWPFAMLVVVFALWFGFLVWMALRFPAR